MSVRDILLRDLQRQWSAAGSEATPTSWVHIARSLANNKYLPIVIFRVASAIQATPARPVAKLLSLANQILFGVEIALRADIGPGLYLPHTGGIVLGANKIGANATIYHGVTLGAQTVDVAYTSSKRPTVGDDVIIGSGAKVLGGVTVGDGAVVGANALVVSDVPAGTTVGGVPAKPLHPLSSNERDA